MMSLDSVELCTLSIVVWSCTDMVGSLFFNSMMTFMLSLMMWQSCAGSNVQLRGGSQLSSRIVVQSQSY